MAGDGAERGGSTPETGAPREMARGATRETASATAANDGAVRVVCVVGLAHANGVITRTADSMDAQV